MFQNKCGEQKHLSHCSSLFSQGTYIIETLFVSDEHSHIVYNPASELSCSSLLLAGGGTFRVYEGGFSWSQGNKCDITNVIC